MKAFGFEITFGEVERFFKSWISSLSCFCVFVLCAIMSFAPECFLKKLQLVGLRTRLGAWLGILLVASFVFLVVPPIRDCVMAYKLSKQFKGKDADRRMAALSQVACRYLLEMYVRPDFAGHFDTTDPSFQALRDGNMIRISAWGEMFNYPCYLQPWVVQWFDKHPDIVEEYKKRNEHSSLEQPYSPSY